MSFTLPWTREMTRKEAGASLHTKCPDLSKEVVTTTEKIHQMAAYAVPQVVE